MALKLKKFVVADVAPPEQDIYASVSAVALNSNEKTVGGVAFL